MVPVISMPLESTLVGVIMTRTLQGNGRAAGNLKCVRRLHPARRAGKLDGLARRHHPNGGSPPQLPDWAEQRRSPPWHRPDDPSWRNRFLCGPSGAGKTTLLYTLAGLERPERGTVRIDGNDLYALPRRRQAEFRNRHIGYVFQNYHLLPELTALENVAVPGAVAGLDTTEAAMRALEWVGLAHRAQHLPAELSGGEQQRAAIARAIVNQPKVLFADEPTGNLDSQNGAAVIDLLTRLAEDSGMTLVVVTHDLGLATAGDRTLVIRDGTLLADA